MNWVKKIENSVGRDGWSATARKCFRLPARQFLTWLNGYRRWRLQTTEDPKTAFHLIYRLNAWGSSESVSGPGSTLEYTTNIRRRLPKLFEEHAIHSVFDAPCGDYHWMPEVVAQTSIKYLGGDLVRPLVAAHMAAHANERVQFRVFDITRDQFPDADLWICRDCLFHLPYHDIFRALRAFANSNIRFALLTNHRNQTGFVNEDIRPGGFRKLDLFAPPFSLPHPVLSRIQEGSGQDTDHEMCLWSRQQISECLTALKQS